MDEDNGPPQGEPVQGFPRLQFFGHPDLMIDVNARMSAFQFLRGLVMNSSEASRCDVMRSLCLDTFDPRTGRFRVIVTEKIRHSEECINDRDEEYSEGVYHSRRFPGDVGIIPLEKTEIANSAVREELTRYTECTVYLLGMLTLPTLAIYCTTNSVPVEKEQRWLLGFVSYITPELVDADARYRVLREACDIIEKSCRFKREVGDFVAQAPVKLADGSLWARDVFMKTDLLGLIACHLDFTSFLRLLFMTNGPMRRWFLRQRAPSGSSDTDRGAMRNRMRVLDFAQRIRDETGIEYTQGSDRHNPMNAFLVAIRKAVDEKRRRTPLKKEESRICFGGCGARRTQGKLIASRVSGTNMCIDCLRPDMLERPEKYQYFISIAQAYNAASWIVTTIHEALIMSCLFFNDPFAENGGEASRLDGYEHWYRVENRMDDGYFRCSHEVDNVSIPVKECRGSITDMILGHSKDRQLRRYIWFDGPSAGFVTFDDIRYAVERVMTTVVTDDLRLPTVEMVKKSSGKLSAVPRSVDPFDMPGILKFPGMWHFMEPEVIDKKMTDSCMDVLHDCYLQRGRIDDYEVCKDVFASRVQSYLRAARMEFLQEVPWVATYLKTL